MNPVPSLGVVIEFSIESVFVLIIVFGFAVSVELAGPYVFNITLLTSAGNGSIVPFDTLTLLVSIVLTWYGSCTKTDVSFACSVLLTLLTYAEFSFNDVVTVVTLLLSK